MKLTSYSESAKEGMIKAASEIGRLKYGKRFAEKIRIEVATKWCTRCGSRFVNFKDSECPKCG